MSRPLRVVVGCDTDPDRLDFGGIPFDAGDRRQVWNGVRAIAPVRDRLDRIRDEAGRAVAVTWHLRVDEQMRVTERSWTHSIEEFRDLWKRCEESGDEIAWHPHFWRLAQDGRTWFHEIDDVDFQRRMLEDAHRAFSEAWGRAPESVRTGWDYHNDATMAALSDLGVRIDLSALPHQSFPGSRNDRGASFAGKFDWSRTGTAPYHPSRSDYMTAGEGDLRLPIVELPQGLLRSRFVGFLGEARGALRDRSLARAFRGAFAKGAVSHTTVKACAPTPLFRAMVRDILRRDEEWIVTYFHPDELLPKKGRLVNDLIHRASYFERNMETAKREALRAGRELRFVTASEAAEILAP